MLVIAYIDGCILQPVMFGLFFNSFLNYFGVHAGYLSATLALREAVTDGWLACAPPDIAASYPPG